MMPVEAPLCEEKVRCGVPRTVATTEKRYKRLTELARMLNVRRAANGPPSVGALLDAIYAGKIVLRRRDDAQGREFWCGMEPGVVRNPRCPGDWD